MSQIFAKKTTESVRGDSGDCQRRQKGVNEGLKKEKNLK